MQQPEEQPSTPHKPKRHLTARVFYTIEVQHTFADDEIQPDPEREEGAFEPTEEALLALGQELSEYLSEFYSVSGVTVDDSETIDTVDETEAPSDFFGGVRPPIMGTDVELPDPKQPRTALTPDRFAFLCNYFSENAMSFHAADARGDVVFFLSVALEQCPAVFESQWGFSYEIPHPEEMELDLLVYDDPDDPLHVPFVFDATNSRYAHEMIRLVEQKTLSFNLLTVKGGRLYFFDQRTVQLSEGFREVLALATRNTLRSVQTGTGAA